MGNRTFGQPDLAPSEDQVCECTDGQNARDYQDDDKRGALAGARGNGRQGVADAWNCVSDNRNCGSLPVDLDDFGSARGLSQR